MRGTSVVNTEDTRGFYPGLGFKTLCLECSNKFLQLREIERVGSVAIALLYGFDSEDWFLAVVPDYGCQAHPYMFRRKGRYGVGVFSWFLICKGRAPGFFIF